MIMNYAGPLHFFSWNISIRECQKYKIEGEEENDEFSSIYMGIEIEIEIETCNVATTRKENKEVKRERLKLQHVNKMECGAVAVNNNNTILLHQSHPFESKKELHLYT